MTKLRVFAVQALGELLDDGDLVEALAAIEHNERWSGWEKYRNQPRTPTEQATAEARWEMQRNTLYADLPERMKESDRVEVRKTLALIREFIGAQVD